MTHVLHHRFIPNSKSVVVGKLDGTHLLSTTWILNPDIKYGTVSEIIAECEQHGLVAVHDLPLHIKVSGSSDNFDEFLQTDLHQFKIGDQLFHVPNADTHIPAKWESDILHILGLCTYPIARSY